MISGSVIATFCGLACAVPALVVGIVGAVLLALRLLSRWGRLERRYAHPWPGGGATASRASVGGTRYKNLLIYRADPEGVSLRVTWPFGLGWKPVRIPWSDLRRTRRIAPLLGLGDGEVEYEVGPAGGDRVVTLRLLDPIGERVDAVAAAHHSAPEHPGA